VLPRSPHFALTRDIGRPLTSVSVVLHGMDWRVASKVPDAMMQ
jgi:hypothetical protein